MIDGQSPLYQLTLNWRKLFSSQSPGKIKVNCKCCSDSGAFTVTEAGPKQGHFETCNFCTDREVLLLDRYLLVKRVGEGNFSSVFLAQDVWATGDEDKVLALKIFHQQYLEIGQAEYENLKRVTREDPKGAFGALKLFHGFRHDRKHFVLVTESLLPTDLFEHSTSLTTQQINAGGLMACPGWVPQLVHNLAMNLYLMHERMDCLHGDLKPENIMYSRSQRKFKLIDYGNSVPMTDVSFYFEDFQFGSLLYRAPEVLVGIPFGKAADIWALGALIFEASCKRPLCNDISNGSISLLTELCEIVGPMPDRFASGKHFQSDAVQLASMFEEEGKEFWHKWRMSNVLQVTGIKDAGFLDLLAGMLDPNPEWRMTIREILGHPLISHLMPFGPPPTSPVAVKEPKVMEKEDIPPEASINNTLDAQIEVLMTEELIKAKSTESTTKAPATSTRKRKR